MSSPPGDELHELAERQDPRLLRALDVVAPGGALREGIDNIVHARTGGLIVVGDPGDISHMLSGGIELGIDYTPAIRDSALKVAQHCRMGPYFIPASPGDGRSANGPAHADELAARRLGPVATVLPFMKEPPALLKTPKGRTIVVCPAQRSDITCAECGLCAKAWRKSIVGFVAHGQGRKLVTSVAEGTAP